MESRNVQTILHRSAKILIYQKNYLFRNPFSSVDLHHVTGLYFRLISYLKYCPNDEFGFSNP